MLCCTGTSTRLYPSQGGGHLRWEAAAAGGPAEKPKPTEAVSPRPGGRAGGKAGEHGGQEGKSVLSAPAFAMSALSQCRDTKTALNGIQVLAWGLVGFSGGWWFFLGGGG